MVNIFVDALALPKFIGLIDIFAALYYARRIEREEGYSAQSPQEMTALSERTVADLTSGRLRKRYDA